jgi:hypothetical protein
MTEAAADTHLRNQQWLLTLVPAFPLVLLVLRLWYLSRQDVPTMLLLVQYVSPLGLLSALVVTLVWALPVVVLVGRALGALLLVSTPSRAEAERSWLVRASLRTPDWVVLVVVVLAALTWQLRFLPALLMATLAIVGLSVRHRYGSYQWQVSVACVALPLLAAAGVYAWVGPAIVQAFEQGEIVTALLLLVPIGLTPLLTGPVPARVARLVTHWPALTAALLAPFLIGAIFLRAPILPAIAMEVRADDTTQPPRIVRGHVITVDDRMTTVLDPAGTVQFVLNEQVVSKTLCPESWNVPASMVDVHGWSVEQTSLGWIAPARGSHRSDSRCQGRPLTSNNEVRR